ncbi:hypothetical protein [Pontibacter vulgaris]|uniref:hypothetical protein n=1 Tax=Pontibacter vulgaris TaxID=2905679 RepID=UPI001FA73CEF|nr:hypothetical protein [Pontibacter vulgaris]
MKKLLVFGTLCLALGVSSCKTYCPAYNYAKHEPAAKPSVPVSNTNSTAIAR